MGYKIRGACDIQGVLLPATDDSVCGIGEILSMDVELELVSIESAAYENEMRDKIGSHYGGWSPKMNLIGNGDLTYTKGNACTDRNLDFLIDDSPDNAYVCTDDLMLKASGSKKIPTFLFGGKSPIEENDSVYVTPTWNDLTRELKRYLDGKRF